MNSVAQVNSTLEITHSVVLYAAFYNKQFFAFGILEHQSMEKLIICVHELSPVFLYSGCDLL
jgi:hypothetical protein